MKYNYNRKNKLQMMINGQNHSKEKEWRVKGRQDKHFKMKRR